jgi:hypothetical protein
MRRSLILLSLAVSILPARTRGTEPVKLAVLEFTSKGGVTQDQMDALSEMLVNIINSMGEVKVIDKSREDRCSFGSQGSSSGWCCSV